MSRYWQFVFIVCLLSTFWVGGLVAQRASAPELIQARRIEIVNAEGKVMVRIGYEPTRGVLGLYDNQGTIIWAAPGSGTVTKGAPQQSKPAAPQLTVSETQILPRDRSLLHRPVKIDPDSCPMVATGLITNQSGTTYRSVNLSINFYDARGTQVGDTSAGTSNLVGGGTWRFEVSIPKKAGIRSFQITQITAE